MTWHLPPMQTLSERHTVYVYLIVWALQFGYATRLWLQWRKSTPPKPKKINGAS